MNEVVLGRPIAGRGQRDAIHIAVSPVVAATDLSPGQPVGFVDAGNTELVGRLVAGVNRQIGIIDPFLLETVKAGQRCYMLLNPGTITSLRHEWRHPAFTPKGSEVDEAWRWLREFASNYRVHLDNLILGATKGTGVRFGTDGGNLDATEEFWRNLETVTGRRFDNEHRENTTFTCSC